MGKRKTPIASKKERQIAWRERMESHPFSEDELSLTTVITAISRQVDKSDMNHGLAALETLLNIFRHLDKNRFPIDYWNKISLDSDIGHISIPLWTFESIVLSWKRYVDGSAEFSLGEAFGVGKGQGERKNTREGIALFRRDFGLAFQVVMRCVNSSESSAPISFEEAYQLVADENNIGERTVARAFSEYKETIRLIVRKHNLPIEFQD